MDRNEAREATAVAENTVANATARKPKSDAKLDYERKAWRNGARLIAGVDEVGRGPLAGDVVVCAVIMDLTNIVSGVDDSKVLSEKKRNELYGQIMEHAVAVAIARRGPEVIDKINILNATKEAMREAVLALDPRPDIILCDAVKIDTDIPCEAIIHGDALSYSISCASIIAKVTRDREMSVLNDVYHGYGFHRNKGYGSVAHVSALRAMGPCPIHRRTYIKNFLEVKDEN